ncbi:hypothetical protein A9R01_07245 ['Osedax' symbiont bacterium Rs2_46_30_T18]|nr:hypothetical protein A9R01_07245 ['Osedax' symbiont bacterium Rs2_46_30_T18]
MDHQLPQVELISSTHQGTVSSFPFSETLDTGIFVNATMTIAGVEVNTIDVALLVLCPVFAALGVMVASLVNGKTQNPTGNIFKRFFSAIFSNIANVFIGIVVGIVISLFFVGAINNDISSLARVLVLTVFLGYKAPLIWSLKKPVEKPTAAVKVKVPTAPAVSQDALKQERLKRARLKIAAKG